MEEKGKVVKVETGLAQVEMEPASACARCGICLQTSGEKPILYVRDSIGVHPGDEVLVYLESKSALKAAFLIYLFPVVSLVAGYFFGQAIFRTEISGILLAGLGFISALFFLYQYDKKLRAQKSIEARIIEVVKRQQE